VNIITKMLILPRETHKREMNKVLMTLDEAQIRVGRHKYIKSRLWEFGLATILSSCVIVIAWLYILVFCEIYAFTAKTWLTSGLTSVCTGLIVTQTVFLFLHLFCRFIAKTVRNE
jgi:hypothetical protein